MLAVLRLEAGRADARSNGNGSLMRFLPIAIWFAGRQTAETIQAAYRFSALTHRHPRSQVGCAIFCLVARRLLEGVDTVSAIDEAWKDVARHIDAEPFTSELREYSRISPASNLKRLRVDEIRGSGYVVDALEASLWCLLNTESFKQGVLTAVNLGDDTDTTGAITGGLAGIRYGLDAVPDEWRERLARHDDLEKLFKMFVVRVEELREGTG